MSSTATVVTPKPDSETRPFATVPIAVISAINVVLLLASYDQYGYFRDELYYLACGKHPAWGYVDQPPLIAWIAWLLAHSIGQSLFAIHLLPALAIGASVWMAALVARELGGGRFAQMVTALLMATMPVALSLGHLFTMNAFDYPLWTAIAFFLFRLENTGNRRLWYAIGALVGIAGLNKYGVFFFVAALIAGLLCTRWRRWLASKHFWLGTALAAIIVLPNLVWQWSHQFPFLQLMENIRRSGRDTRFSFSGFMLQQVMIVLPISFVLSVIGAVWLLLSRKFRAAGIAFIVFFAGMFALSAKNYYLGPVYPMMFGAAGVALEQWTRNRMRWIAIGAVALNCVSSVLALPLAIPILSPEKFIAYQKAIGIQEPKFENQKRGALPQIYADMFGWEDMVKTTAAFYHTLTPEEQRNTAIFGDTYGEAGALSFWAKKYGLPEPIGPHQTFWIWGPRDYHRADMINVGSRDDRALRASCDSVTVIGHADNPLSRPDTHFDIYYCKGFHYDFQELWPRLKRFR